jgi:hypothetical protein
MRNLPGTILNFAATDDRKKGYEKVVEYYKSYVNGKKELNGISFAEADKMVHEWFMKEVASMANINPDNYSDVAVYAGLTSVKEAAFAVVGMITDLIIPEAFVNIPIADIKYGAWGDSLKIDLKPRDLFVVSKGGRSKRSFDLKRQYSGTATIIPEPHVLSVGVSLYDIMTGKQPLAEFIVKAIQSLEVQMRYDLYDAFTTAMLTLANSGDAKLRYAGWDAVEATTLAQTVSAWNGGGKAIFLGTKVALGKVLPSNNNYRYDLIGSDYVKLGHVRDFNGFDVIELEQVADYTTEFKLKLNDKHIYVISPGSDKIVKGFVEGSTLSNIGTNYANANLQVGADMVKSYNFGVHTSSIGGLIVLP